MDRGGELLPAHRRRPWHQLVVVVPCNESCVAAPGFDDAAMLNPALKLGA